MDRLRVAEVVQKVADEALTSFRRRDFAIQMKDTIDPVTDADLRAEDQLREALLKIASGPFWGEESYNQEPIVDGWVVDPIDGTVNFASGFPMWAVNVAWFEAGHATLAVTIAPAMGEVFTAQRGEGSFVGNRRMQVCADRSLKQSVGATGFPYWLDNRPDSENNIELFGLLLHRSRAIRRAGCASLDMAYVADGRFGFYWEPGLKPWDVGGGALMVEEAGGKVSRYDGQPMPHYFAPILASNGLLHEELISVLTGFDLADAEIPALQHG